MGLSTTSEDGQTKLEVRLVDETVWLNQKQMAALFQKDVRTISEHISNIFQEEELLADSVIRNLRITAADGKMYIVVHYDLDVIISTGYRVKTHRDTQFRQSATRLHNYKRYYSFLKVFQYLSEVTYYQHLTFFRKIHALPPH